MRILLLTNQMSHPESPLGGTFNIPRMRELRALGHDVKIICPISLTPPEKMILPVPRIRSLAGFLKRHKAIPAQDNIEGFTVYYPKFAAPPRKVSWYGELYWLHLLAGRRIRKIIREFRPEVFVGSWLHPYGSYAKYIKRWIRIPCIALVEGSDLLVYPKKYRGIEKINKVYRRFVDCVAFGSVYIRETTAIDFPVEYSVVNHNGFDCTGEENILPQRSVCPPDSPFRIISVGSLTKIKGHDLLLEALTKLPDNYHLDIRGDGPEGTRYENIIRDNGLAERVRIIERLSDEELREFYLTADLYCQPSRSESLPAAPMEAMSFGLPVVASKAGGLPELIREGENGYMFGIGNTTELANQIRKASDTMWDRHAIAESVRKDWGWNRWAESFHQLITELKEHYDRDH